MQKLSFLKVSRSVTDFELVILDAELSLQIASVVWALSGWSRLFTDNIWTHKVISVFLLLSGHSCSCAWRDAVCLVGNRVEPEPVSRFANV
jgi:hypothetical protein